MLVGITTDDQRLIDISSKVYDTGLDAIQADGTLPREMARGQMALAYNAWACAPLYMMSELARKSGKDWYGRNNNKLSLLAERVTSGLIDPNWFEQKTGIKQKIPGGRNLAWLELYRRVAKNLQDLDKILVNKKYYRSILGGNLTALGKIDYFNPGYNK